MAGDSTEASSPCCAKCSKTSVPLKVCAKCRSTRYCSRECQTGGWKAHKRECTKARDGSTPKDTSSGPVSWRISGYLASLPRQKALEVLIDSYRLRVEDEYVFRGENRGLYAQEDPVPDFEEYVERAEKKRLLPSWWDESARADLLRLGTSESGSFFLGHAVEKHDISESYGNSWAPMQLRMVAELIEGSRVA